MLLTTTAEGRGLYDVAVRVLEDAGHTVTDTGSEPADEPTLTRLAASADAILATLAPLGAAVIEAGADLKVIAKVGAGVDNIDVAAATRRNLPVCNTPGANAESVADHVLALILAIARRVLPLDAITRAGRGWESWPPYLGEELGGKVLGIVGLGRAGQAVARRGRAFGMECQAHEAFADRLAPEATEEVVLTSLDELLSTADYVSLHVPLSHATQGLVGARELRLMKPTAVLINTARGPVVDEAALVRALRDGEIGGAGIDVFEHEPPVDSALFALDDVVLTPHVAGMTTEATAGARRLAAASIIAALSGETPPRVVNDVLPGAGAASG